MLPSKPIHGEIDVTRRTEGLEPIEEVLPRSGIARRARLYEDPPAAVCKRTKRPPIFMAGIRWAEVGEMDVIAPTGTAMGITRFNQS